MKEHLKRAAIGIIRHDGRFLAVSRRDDLTDMGFPGGKIEDWESLEAGLIREVYEEVGIHVQTMRHVLCRVSHQHLVHVFEIINWSGQPTSMEGTAIAWLTEEEMSQQKTFGTFNQLAIQHL
jgi:8-oxo-dGTP diphosphatase